MIDLPTQLPEYWQFIAFPLIGAMIGVVTNDVAIRMLFHPYRPIHVGSMRLPFTPGLIPGQRHVISKNIAQTFEAQLLSGDEIHGFLVGDRARVAVEGKIDEMLKGLGPMAAMAAGFKPMIVDKILQGIEEMATEAIDHGGELNIGQRIEQKINDMDIATLEELILGFSRKQFRHITFFGGVLGFLIGVVQAFLSHALA